MNEQAELPKNEHENETTVSYSLRQRIQLGIGLPLWVLFGFVVATVLVSGIVEWLAVSGVLENAAINDSVVYASVAGAVYSLALAIVIGLPHKFKNFRTSKEELGLARLPNWQDILFAPVSYLVYAIIAVVLTVAVTQVVPNFDAEQVQDVGFDGISKYYEYVLAFITLVIVAPVAEEVLMRGYLYGKLRKLMPIVVATLITSLLFSVMHLQWNVAVNVLPLGVVLVVLREMTGSIWAGILLHMLKNGIAFYLLFINPSFLSTIGR